jgi:hypothetical protein
MATHPDHEFDFLNVDHNSRWNALTPPVFRFMQQKYVDVFFDHGRLRLSSITRFEQHQDEQRGDTSEGWGFIAVIGKANTLTSVMRTGEDFYVLCGSANLTKGLCAAFGDCDAAMVIDAPLLFAQAIERHIPQFVRGFVGPTVYREGRYMHKFRDLTAFDKISKKYNLKKLPGSATIDEYRAHFASLPADYQDEFKAQVYSIEPLFLKNSKYSDQAEYRFLWQSSAQMDPYLDITAPEAVQFCRRVPMPLP